MSAGQHAAIPAQPHWAAARAWQTNAALCLIGAGLFGLTRQLISESTLFTLGFSGVSFWSAVLYLAAVFLILTQPVNRFTFGIILSVAIACRLVAVFPEPFLSSDVYRYAWDGVVQHAHISPYRYVPGDPALTMLREPNQNLFDNINRRDYAHTIYPPAAQVLFYLVTLVNPTVTAMKTAMILFEGLTMYGLVQLLGAFGVRREQSLLYAWCPLLIWEIAEAGHLDSAAMAFIVLAMVARYRRQPLRTGLWLGLAVMVKMYPIVLLPALFRRGEYRMPGLVAAVIAFGYACYAGVGMRVFGFLGGYVAEEGLRSGERYFFLGLAERLPGLAQLPGVVFLPFCCLVFAGLSAWCWRTCCRVKAHPLETAQTRWFGLPAEADFVVPAFALGFVLMLLFSPHYPWYVAWLVPFLTLVPNLTVLTYLCAVFYLRTTGLATGQGGAEFLLNEMLYGATLAAFAIEAACRRWSLHRFVMPLLEKLPPVPARKGRA